MTEIDLFSWQPPKETAFGGATYEAEFDHTRLTQQLKDVFDLMKDGRWRTLPEIADNIKHPTQSISARLRDLRKDKYGAHTVERERHGNGLFQYRLIVRVREAA